MIQIHTISAIDTTTWKEGNFQNSDDQICFAFPDRQQGSSLIIWFCGESAKSRRHVNQMPARVWQLNKHKGSAGSLSPKLQVAVYTLRLIEAFRFAASACLFHQERFFAFMPVGKHRLVPALKRGQTCIYDSRAC